MSLTVKAGRAEAMERAGALGKEISPAELFALYLSKQLSLIDVRSPIEFSQGHLPGAKNLPLLDDKQRALVGTCYKKHGRDSAISLGHKLISGPLRESRIRAWELELETSPLSALYCFRGGLRSKTAQSWLEEQGLPVPIVAGGYKASRWHLTKELEEFSLHQKFWVISGKTGSHKTQFIKELMSHLPSLDLEALAHHRGSAFGAHTSPQPSQVDFENRLAIDTLKIRKRFGTPPFVLIEDESRMIGQIVQTESFFTNLRRSPLILIEEPLEVRAQNILRDYVLAEVHCGATPENIEWLYRRFQEATIRISKKLGGLRASEILKDIQNSKEEHLIKNNFEANLSWIKKLLKYYYDPLYDKSLERRRPEIKFTGCRQECLEWIFQLA